MLQATSSKSEQYLLEADRYSAHNYEPLPVVIERAEGNYSTYSPDSPGCIATRSTPEEAK